MSETERPPQSLVVTLAALTVAGGLLDAVSFLGLGHVFINNMTGNVILIGFAAAGAPSFSFTASLTALGGFMVGAVVGGRMAQQIGSHRTLLLVAMVLETVLVAVAAVMAAAVSDVGVGWPRFTVIVLLAFSLGVRLSALRRMGVPDMTTSVLTTTLTRLASDSSLAGGANDNVVERGTSVLCMFGGALVGAVLLLHVGAVWSLGAAAAIVAVTAAFYARQAPQQQLGLAH
jgi:uncharacterized membrane protein YoaK (UPF0700 family)